MRDKYDFLTSITYFLADNGYLLIHLSRNFPTPQTLESLGVSSARNAYGMHAESLENAQEARVAVGHRLEQLLRFFRALQTSRVHP